MVKKALTQKEKKRLLGLPINLCLVTIESIKLQNIKVQGRIKKFPIWAKRIPVVYKKIKQDDSKDELLMSRLKTEVLKSEKEKDSEFKIKSIEIIKNIGNGIYEE